MHIYIYIHVSFCCRMSSPGLHGNLQLVLFEDFLPPMGQPHFQPPVFFTSNPIRRRLSKSHTSPRERHPKVAAHHPPALSGPKTALPAVLRYTTPMCGCYLHIGVYIYIYICHAWKLLKRKYQIRMDRAIATLN